MQNDIKRECILRQEKMGDLDDFLTQDTSITTKFLEKFEKDATNEAEKFMGDLEKEMNSRFDHQNNILDNMSRFVGKFQSTLKIFGKDV
jgi:DNA-directed RNA polymerase subunit F